MAAVSIRILPSEYFHLGNKLAKGHWEFFLNMERRADILDAIPQSKAKSMGLAQYLVPV